MGVINSGKEDALCEKAVKDLQIKTPNVEIDSGNLSGGNQQKVVVGKWLARDSRVVIFDEPTRGIDVGAKVEIYNLMNELKKQGVAVYYSFLLPPSVSLILLFSKDVAIVRISSWVASLAETSPVIRPSHITMIRSAIPMTSGISEDTNITAIPCFFSSFIRL